jgi:predicted XRE-type DNA-binding protein
MVEPNEQIERGSSNVFADLGYQDAEERRTKVRLAQVLNDELAKRGLTQKEAARLLGLGQPKVSALANYRLSGFSLERLLTLLTALDRDVDIVLREKASSQPRGAIKVLAE